MSIGGMKKQNTYCLRKVDMGVVRKGMVPEKLLDLWIEKHNNGMDWIAVQRLRAGIKGDPIPIYIKNYDEEE